METNILMIFIYCAIQILKIINSSLKLVEMISKHVHTHTNTDMHTFINLFAYTKA